MSEKHKPRQNMEDYYAYHKISDYYNSSTNMIHANALSLDVAILHLHKIELNYED